MVLNIDCMLESLGKVLFVFNANRGFPGDTVVKNLPANAGDTRDLGSIVGSGRSNYSTKKMAIYYSILAWKIP